MKSKFPLGMIVLLALIAGALAGGLFVAYRQPPAFCEISGRPIQANMLTRVKVDGKVLYACCARCPLTLAVRTHRRVEILEVTDYATGKRLRARDAFFVDGSRMEMCSGPHVKFDQYRTPYMRLFDRCSPSLLAFGSEENAQDFINTYGGRLQKLDDLIKHPLGSNQGDNTQPSDAP
jgi:hypothetical protein